MTRKAKPKSDKKLIIDAFTEMARSRNVDKDLLQEIIKDTFSMLVKKKYGNEANFEIVVNMDKGDIEIYLIRSVVDEVFDPTTEIHISEANLEEPDAYDLGDDYLEEITLENIAENFGRRLITMAGQTLNQRLRDLEKDNLFKEYSDKVGEIIVGEVYQIRRNDMFILHNNIELRLPREEQIPNERHRKNETIRALVKEVRRSGGQGNNPEIIVSRADPAFLAKLFEIEIPEIYDGLIELRGIAREPGERAKVAVYSYDERIDPVGACVGMKGIRIHSIVRELNNENIDVIPFDDDPINFIAGALGPARPKEIHVFPDTMNATVIVSDDQVSLAIGKSGQNVRLASKLTGYAISVIKEGGEDIELIEFREELGQDLYNSLIESEIDTAREFLDADPLFVMRVTGLSKEALLELRSIMLTEFEETESEETRNYILSLAFDPTAEDAEETNDGEASTQEEAHTE